MRIAAGQQATINVQYRKPLTGGRQAGELILKTMLASGAACAIPAGETATARVLKGQGDLLNVQVLDGSCAQYTGWVAWPAR